ncbi:MAG TPA: nuclear transport factor 2 family protein [Gammaproteobacteria bacterium]|nr:nuclear transport factor 2 family protein [Gammaproteobacteria bacterium]
MPRSSRGWTTPRAPAQSAPPSDTCNDYLTGDCAFAPHFDPRRAGTPSPPVVVSPTPVPADAAPADLGARVADLGRRAARLADETAVTNLQHAYGYYVDRKRWDDVADLFAADATLELGNRGVYAGRPSIRRALEQFGPQGLKPGELNDHLQLQTLVTVAPDGAAAQARGVELVQWGGIRDGAYRAEWRESIYENRYVNEGGVWKIAAMHLYPRFITDYAQGWAKSAEPVPPPSKDFPPDRPPTAEYAVYPKFSIPPLHFVNPATGAPPQYPDDARPPASSVPPSAAAAPARAPTRGGGSLADRLTAAERAAAVAIAYDAAENLLNAHSYYLDEARWDDVADLFAANGWDEVGQLGVYAGRERIRSALRALHPRDGRSAGVLAIRQTTQPVIDVAPDGTSAKIRERVLQVGGRAGAEGEWLAGVYEGEAVLEDGAWKLAGLDLDYTWAAPYHGGWAAVAAAGHFQPDSGVGSDPGIGAVRVAPGADASPAFTLPSGLPEADRALRGPVRPPFPEILRVPFHYANPVSGRPAR